MSLLETANENEVHLDPCCPKCSYSGVHKRKRPAIWVCSKCGWSGQAIGRKAQLKKRILPKHLKLRVSSEGV